MADDLDFGNIEDLENLDWGQLDQEHRESAQGDEKGGAAGAAAGAAPGGGGNEAMISSGGSAIDIHYLLDVNLQATVEVGRRQFFISDILSWSPGSIIELDKVVGEPLNLLVNQKPVAKGEVVVVNDKYAIKILEIMDPHDRLAHIQS